MWQAGGVRRAGPDTDLSLHTACQSDPIVTPSFTTHHQIPLINITTDIGFSLPGVFLTPLKRVLAWKATCLSGSLPQRCGYLGRASGSPGGVHHLTGKVKTYQYTQGFALIEPDTYQSLHTGVNHSTLS